MAERARREYLAAYALRHDVYPGINAATLSLLLGDRAAALTLAQEIVARLTVQASPRTFWDHATLGEAQLVLGQFDQAAQSYASRLRAKRRRCGERGHDAAAAAAARARDSGSGRRTCSSCPRPTSSRSPAT